MTVAAVVLAAGGGTRFRGETHKLLAVVRERAVVAWAVEHALAAGLDETVVVTGAIDLTEHLPVGVTVVANPRWAEGQATSLQAAIAHARSMGHDAVVIGLGDQPFVPAEAWRLVAATGADLATAIIDGHRTPPVRIAEALWDELPTQGDEGARVLLRGRPDLVVPVACPGSAVDIDTVEDLSAWN
ncbi:MAG TPA: nucleotidyltransferase family protein [Acidimicrobiales bacterium]|jgi:CTP:molybdopterin cytidylyltransferase MocA|nr:nucleotidyltransferase family protein [Acidimicrobiales bacterium]